MARCPFGSHRLILAEDFTCKRCGEDLRLYSAVSDLHVVCYNEARRLWDAEEWEEAVTWLHAALLLRADFSQAHWLLGAVEAKRGRPHHARSHLTRARELGAEADPDWVSAPSAVEQEEANGDARLRPEEAPRLINAVVRFCQDVHTHFPEAVITSANQSEAGQIPVLCVTTPDGQNAQSVAEVVKQLVLGIEDACGVTIFPILQAQPNIHPPPAEPPMELSTSAVVEAEGAEQTTPGSQS